MARTMPAFVGGGFLLGGLGALGWHFQPVVDDVGAPRPAYQVLQALGGIAHTGGPLYSGVVADDALSWWHEPSWVPIVALPVLGVVVGTVVGAVVVSLGARAHRRSGTTGPAPRGTGRALVGSAVMGLVLGSASALAWHWEPQALMGGPWNGRWFWPVDVIYPVLGLLLALGAAATLIRWQRPPSTTTGDLPPG